MHEVVNHVWESTLFGVAAAAFTLIFTRNRAAVRYAIWFAASAKFLIPFAALAVAGRHLTETWLAGGETAELAGIVFRATAVAALPAQYSSLIAYGWMAGALAVATVWIVQWCRIADRIRREPRVTDGPVYDAVVRLRAKCGVARPIDVVSIDISREPGVFGIRRPVLLWPSRLSTLSRERIDAVVAHELAHVARGDNLHASLHMLVSAIFWFHPLVWWIGARLVHERERACDERVLALGQQPAIYAASILDICRQCLSSTLANVPGVTGGNLSQRIAHIMNRKSSIPLSPSRRSALALAALLAVLPGMAAHMPAQTPEDKPEKVGPGIEPPRILREVKPQYSARAMQAKIQGEVELECVVRTNGKVTDITVVRSLDGDLDQAAVDALSQSEFEPGKRSGKAINVQVNVSIRFTLKD